MKQKLRKLGDITSDLEPLLLEMVVVHEMQFHEILGIIHSYLEVHCPEAKEKYLTGGSPIYFYGPKEGLK